MSKGPGIKSIVNPIIIKQHPEIGKSKVTTFNLPDSNYTYGKKSNKADEGAKESKVKKNILFSNNELEISLTYN